MNHNWRIRFAIASWWLWQWQNEEVFCVTKIEDGEKVEKIVGCEKKTVTAWELMRKTRGELSAREEALKKCSRPLALAIKDKVGGAVNGNSGIIGVGCVARDHRGCWVDDEVGNVAFTMPLMAELLVIWHGLRLALGLGARQIILEFDSFHY